MSTKFVLPEGSDNNSLSLVRIKLETQKDANQQPLGNSVSSSQPHNFRVEFIPAAKGEITKGLTIELDLDPHPLSMEQTTNLPSLPSLAQPLSSLNLPPVGANFNSSPQPIRDLPHSFRPLPGNIKDYSFDNNPSNLNPFEMHEPAHPFGH